MLKIRVITAIIGIPLLVFIIFWGPTWSYFALMFAATAVSLYEYYNMVIEKRFAFEKLIGIIFGLVLFIALAISLKNGILTLTFVFLALFIWHLFFYKDQESVIKLFGLQVAGLIYVSLLMAFLYQIKLLQNGALWVGVVFLVTWCSDSAAYFTGRYLGKRKLYEKVSPKKTWEGSVGGILGSVISILLVKLIAQDSFAASFWDCIFIAIPANILGQVGDLCESLMKRSFNVKDSGVIIPGHGGILDRIDAVLFSAPYFYFYMTVVLKIEGV